MDGTIPSVFYSTWKYDNILHWSHGHLDYSPFIQSWRLIFVSYWTAVLEFKCAYQQQVFIGVFTLIFVWVYARSVRLCWYLDDWFVIYWLLPSFDPTLQGSLLPRGAGNYHQMGEIGHEAKEESERPMNGYWYTEGALPSRVKSHHFREVAVMFVSQSPLAWILGCMASFELLFLMATWEYVLCNSSLRISGCCSVAVI